MLKTSLIVIAMLAAVPAVAQDATPAAKMPMCSAKVKDSCQQSKGEEARAMTAAQADKAGRFEQAAMAGPAGSTGMAGDTAAAPKKKAKHHHHAMKAKAAAAAAPAADAAAPK